MKNRILYNSFHWQVPCLAFESHLIAATPVEQLLKFVQIYSIVFKTQTEKQSIWKTTKLLEQLISTGQLPSRWKMKQ